MKRLSSAVIAVLGIALIFGCSKSPVESSTDEIASMQLTEYKVLEADFAAATIDDEPDTNKTINEKRKIRLRRQLFNLKKFLDRLRRYENKFPNDDAEKLIRQAYRLNNAAITAFENGEFRKAYRFAKRARKYAHDAIVILKPKRRNRNNNGGG